MHKVAASGNVLNDKRKKSLIIIANMVGNNMRCSCDVCGANKTYTNTHIKCPNCLGKKCDECDNKGAIEIRECLGLVYKDEEEFINAYSFLKKYNILPIGNCYMDQAGTFINAVLFLDGEIASFEKKNEPSSDDNYSAIKKMQYSKKIKQG